MINLDVPATVKIDLSTPFCAYTYYTGLRHAGCEPFVNKFGLYQGLDGDPVAQLTLGKWAAHHDPRGTLRIDYARMMWAARAPDDEIIPLGAKPKLT